MTFIIALIHEPGSDQLYIWMRDKKPRVLFMRFIFSTSCGADSDFSPVTERHLSGFGVDHMDDDASVPPAPGEQVVVLVAFSGLEGLVEECPRQLLPSVDLQRPSRPHAQEFPAKVAVFLVAVIRSERKCVTFFTNLSVIISIQQRQMLMYERAVFKWMT